MMHMEFRCFTDTEKFKRMNQSNRHFANLMTFAVVTLLPSHGLFAQSSAIPTNIRASYTVGSLSQGTAVNKNDVLYGVPAPPGKVVGDSYLSTYWRKSAVQLYKDDKLIEGYDTRYDIQADVLDVKTTAGVKVLEGKRIRSFSWRDSTRVDPVFFVNAHDYKIDGIPMTGFFEVLVDGPAPLLKYTTLQIKKADYNVSFDVGSRDDKILKQASYYAGKGKNVVKLGTSKKKVLTLFEDKVAEMEKYMDDSQVSLKKEADLVRTWQHYNSLLPQ